MKLHTLVFALTLLPATAGFAQDSIPPKPPGTPLLDNEQIRVREVRFAPRSKLPSASRPNTFLYALTDGSLVFTPAGGKEYELTFRAGEALWLPSQETATANEGEKEVRALVVELKGRAPAGKAAKGSKKGGKGKKGGKKGGTKS